MLNARTPFRTRIRARTTAEPNIDKCAVIAAIVSAIFMFAIVLTMG